MPYVSAKYGNPDPMDPPEMAKPVSAIDEQGQVWSFREDSQVGDWLEYRGKGGYIEPADPIVISSEQVNVERDRRITSGFDYMGHRFQSDDFSQRNIMDASQVADAAIADGAEDDDYSWRYGDPEDFAWIDADNVPVPMTAYDVRGLAQHLINWKEHCIWVARDIKDLDPIPLDYQDDSHWVYTPPPELPV